MKSFFIAVMTLALVHSGVSLGAYRFLTTTTVDSSTDAPPVETTTSDERATGRSSFNLMHTEMIRRAIPTLVVFYVWAGYIGLAASALYALYFRFRHGQ